MDVTLGIIIAVLIVLFFVFLKLLKSVLKALSVVVVVFIIIGLVIGLMIYSDLNKFERLVSGKKILLFYDEQNFKAGVEIPPIREINQILIKGAITHYSESELENFKEKYTNKELSLLTPEDGLLIIILPDALKEHSVLELENVSVNISSEDFLTLINSNSIEQELSLLTKNLNEQDATSVENYLNYNYESAQKIKNLVFYKMFLDSSKENSGLFLINNIRTNKIIISPEFNTIKSLSFVPYSLSDSMTGKIAAEGS